MIENNGTNDIAMQDLDSLLEEGYEEYLMHNSDRAIELFDEVLVKDNENYKALFYKLTSYTIGEFLEFANFELENVVNYIRKLNKSDKEFSYACIEYVIELNIFCAGALRLLDEYDLDEEDKIEAQTKLVIVLNNFLVNILNALDDTNDVCEGFFNMLLKYMKAYERDIDELSDIGLDFANYRESYLLVAKHFNADAACADITFCASRIEKFTTKSEQLKEINSEMSDKCNDLIELSKEKRSKTKEEFMCEESKEKEKLVSEISLLNKQKNEFSFFKIKEKKQLQLLIDEKTELINNYDKIIEEKKKDRNIVLLDEAKKYIDEAGILLKKIERNQTLIDAMVDKLKVWYAFNTVIV